MPNRTETFHHSLVDTHQNKWTATLETSDKSTNYFSNYYVIGLRFTYLSSLLVVEEHAGRPKDNNVCLKRLCGTSEDILSCQFFTVLPPFINVLL
jgi:hypothetical protein